MNIGAIEEVVTKLYNTLEVQIGSDYNANDWIYY